MPPKSYYSNLLVLRWRPHKWTPAVQPLYSFKVWICRCLISWPMPDHRFRGKESNIYLYRNIFKHMLSMYIYICIYWYMVYIYMYIYIYMYEVCICIYIYVWYIYIYICMIYIYISYICMIYIYIYVCIYIYVYIYVCIYIERER